MKYLENYKIFETLNSRGSKSITEDEFNSILEKNCKVWLDGVETKLYRSQRDMGDYVYTDARGTKRRSIENINIHVELIDNLECWKNYPKYSEAIIGITENKDVNYGNTLYELIPFDNIKIAVCPENNIWSCFSKHGRRFGEYIYDLHGFMDETGLSDQWIQEDNRTLEEIFKSIGNVDDYLEDKGIRSYYCDDFLDKVCYLLNNGRGRSTSETLTGDDIFRCISEIMFNPVEQGFDLCNYTEDFSKNDDLQIWCNSPVLLKRIDI